jgi:hypothetical protein
MLRGGLKRGWADALPYELTHDARTLTFLALQGAGVGLLTGLIESAADFSLCRRLSSLRSFRCVLQSERRCL